MRSSPICALARYHGHDERSAYLVVVHPLASPEGFGGKQWQRGKRDECQRGGARRNASKTACGCGCAGVIA